MNKISSHGVLQERTLVLATSGIYLLKYRTFPKGFIVSRLIPFVDFISLSINEVGFTVKSDVVSFTISHSNYISIAAKIYRVFSTLFLNPHFHFLLSVGRTEQNEFESDPFIYPPEKRLANRFVGCLLHTKFDFNESILLELYEKLSKINKDVIITNNTLTNPYCSAIIQAIALDQELTDLTLLEISMAAFIQYFPMIVRYSTTIKRIVMKDVSFSPPLKDIRNLFKHECNLSSTEFIFERCNFESHDSTLFFKAFSNYPTEIKLLIFKDCRFCVESLDALFQMVFFVPSFHKLETLEVSGLHMPEELSLNLIQLSCCKWVLETHCLTNLSIIDCGIKIDFLLPQLLAFDSGISILDLSGNILLNPLPPPLQPISSVDTLILSNCQFTNDSLFSVFFYIDNFDISNKATPSLTLDVSNAQGVDWTTFYSRLASPQAGGQPFTVQKMTGLIWDNNQLLSDNIEKFFNFLIAVPHLHTISISKCFCKGDHDQLIGRIPYIFQRKKIQSFSLCGEQMGPKFGSIVMALLRYREIQVLNVDNEGFGDTIMTQIIVNLPSCLREFTFQGYHPTSPESLIKALQAILANKGLTYASWPEDDVYDILEDTSSENRPYYRNRFNQLKASFIERFGTRWENVDTTMAMITRYETRVGIRKTTTNARPQRKPKARRESYLIDNQSAMDKFVTYDSETRALIVECGDIEGDDPMERILNEIQKNTSLDTLVKDVLHQ